MPASAFYEWKAQSKTKQPYAIGFKTRGLVGFAGLWERWKGPDGPVEGYAIVTTEPNEICAPIHNRMPAIITPINYAAWLDVDGMPPEKAAKMLRVYPAKEMTCGPVSTHVTKPANDDAACLEPVAGDVA